MIISNTPVFNVTKTGSYPSEKYVYRPIAFTNANLPTDFYIPNGQSVVVWSQLNGNGTLTSNGQLLFKSFVNYVRNAHNQVLDYWATENLTPGFTDVIYYGPLNTSDYPNIIYDNTANPSYAVNLDKTVPLKTRYIETPDTIQFFNSSTMTYDIGYLRSSTKSPYSFYFYALQLNDTTKNSYGFMTYPSRIFLKPISCTNNNGLWQLQTQATYINDQTIHLQSNSIEFDAFMYHKNFLDNPPLTNLLWQNVNDTNTIVYSLCSCQTYVDLAVVDTSPTTPTYSLVNLQPNIYPDSTFVAYAGTFSDGTNTLPIQQDQRDITYYRNNQSFSPSYILNQLPNTKKQTYQLLQGPFNNTTDFSDASNCALSAIFNLDTGTFQFLNYYTKAKVDLSKGQNFTVDYMFDSAFFGTTPVGQTAVPSNNINVFGGGYYTLNTQSYTIGTDIRDNIAIWQTKYPPYYYSYKIAMYDSAGNYLDDNSLNFYLKVSGLFVDTQQAVLSAFFASDFNLIRLPLSSIDTINYQLIDSYPTPVSALSSKIVALYGRYYSDPYTFGVDVPADQGQNLKLYYVGQDFAGTTFSIRATVNTKSGQHIDSYNVETISLAIPNSLSGNNIFLNTILEESNLIEVDSSFNVSASSWPSRDLTNTEIQWKRNRNDLNLSLYYIDDNGNYLGNVNGPVTFGPNTWKVALSGYGPSQITISLSSQKYNEVAYIKTNPTLFNFLSEANLSVGVAKPLNNLSKTRTVTLTAAIPYDGVLYNIPPNMPISWTWEYDNITDPTLQPVQITQPLNNNLSYLYGSNTASKRISAIDVQITPGYSKTTPKIHNVKFTAALNVTQPPITGSYIIKVDDFPDPSIFNSDFHIEYKLFKKYGSIADTKTGPYTITRPICSELNFEVTPYFNLVPNYVSYQANWLLNNKNIRPITGVNDVFSLNYNISSLPQITANNLSVSTFNVGIALTATVNGWTSAHCVNSTLNGFLMNPVDFYNPLKFIIYPEFAFIGYPTTNDQGDPILAFDKATYLTPSNFTYAFMPSAYVNKRSNSQTWWLSANTNYFDHYLYQNQETYTIIDTISSFALLDIPYAVDSIQNYTGQPISLFAYNSSFYPENLNSNYLYVASASSYVFYEYKISQTNPQTNITVINTITALSGIITTDNRFIQYQNIVLEDNTPVTIPSVHNTTNLPPLSATSYWLIKGDYNVHTQTTTTKPTTAVYDNFSMSPVLFSYNDLTMDYIFFATDDKNAFIDIIGPDYSLNVSDENHKSVNIGIGVQFGTFPEYSPAIPVGGTITCILSSQYWIEYKDLNLTKNPLSAIMFKLNYGDPAIPLNCGEFGIDSFNLSASANIQQQIPSNVFSVDRDLWNVINITT